MSQSDLPTVILSVNVIPMRQLSEQCVCESQASLRGILIDQCQRLKAAHFTHIMIVRPINFFIWVTLWFNHCKSTSVLVSAHLIICVSEMMEAEMCVRCEPLLFLTHKNPMTVSIFTQTPFKGLSLQNHLGLFGPWTSNSEHQGMSLWTVTVCRRWSSEAQKTLFRTEGLQK